MSLLSIGELLPPEESYPHLAHVDARGALLVGHANGVLSVFEPPAWARRFVVRSACGASVTAAARSASDRFFAVGTVAGVTVLDLERDRWTFRPVEHAVELAIDDAGRCDAITRGERHRFDGADPGAPAEVTADSPAIADRGDFTVDDAVRSMTFRGATLGPTLPDASILSARGVLVARRGEGPRWLAFADGASRALDVEGEAVGGLALSRGFAAASTWGQHVVVASLDGGRAWRHKALRKSDLGGDDLPAMVLTDAGEAVVAQHVRGLLCLEALAWFGAKGRRARRALPASLGRTLSTLLDADGESALLHVAGRKGLWVFGENTEAALVPALDVRSVDALDARRAFVLRLADRRAVLATGERVIGLDRPGEGDGDGAGPTRLERAAFSDDGAWLALRFATDAPREAELALWDAARGVEIARWRARRIAGALGWCRPGTADLAVDADGTVISATAPSVYGFFAPGGALVREVCALPDGEWIARTSAAWAHSAGAFRWGGLRLRGRVLDEAGARGVLGPAKGASLADLGGA